MKVETEKKSVASPRTATVLQIPLSGPTGLLLDEKPRRKTHDRCRALHAAILALEGASDKQIAGALQCDPKTARADGRRLAHALRCALRSAGYPVPIAIRRSLTPPLRRIREVEAE